MQSKKIIAVIGATGSQGSGLVRAILNDPSGGFAVRAITRDVNSKKAQEYAKLGAEVVSADIDNIDSLRKALHGAYGAYFVTFFWEHFSPEKEQAQVRNMAQAAKDEGLKHVIWSSLEDTRQWIPLTDNRMPTLMGKYKVPHFDAKGEADKIFAELGVPTTIVLATFYWDNLVGEMAPKKGPNGELALTIPMGKRKLIGIATEDIGRCAYGVFKKGSELIGKTIGIEGEALTVQEMADAMTKALGQKVNYNEVPFDTYRSFGFPGCQDLGNMFQFYHDFDEVFAKNRSLELSKQLNPELKSFDAWLAENAKKIKIE